MRCSISNVLTYGAVLSDQLQRSPYSSMVNSLTSPTPGLNTASVEFTEILNKKVVHVAVLQKSIMISCVHEYIYGHWLRRLQRLSQPLYQQYVIRVYIATTGRHIGHIGHIAIFHLFPSDETAD